MTGMGTGGRRALRDQLGSTVASAAGPYGYTISLGGSTALASNRLGTPHLFGALMLMTGAVVAFVILEAVGSRGSPLIPAAQDRPPSVWGNAHIPSAGASLCAVWAVVHLLGGPLAWALVGFIATGVYFVVTALQRIVIARDEPPS